MSDYKIIDYPHCAICEHSEQYKDDTLFCMINDKEDAPTSFNECGEFKFAPIYLIGFLEILTKLIKEKEDK